MVTTFKLEFSIPQRPSFVIFLYTQMQTIHKRNAQNKELSRQALSVTSSFILLQLRGDPERAGVHRLQGPDDLRRPPRVHVDHGAKPRRRHPVSGERQS